ncbi:hypothetical protein Dimus_004154, partial [Dionaea muscipula]
SRRHRTAEEPWAMRKEKVKGVSEDHLIYYFSVPSAVSVREMFGIAIFFTSYWY